MRLNLSPRVESLVCLAILVVLALVVLGPSFVGGGLPFNVTGVLNYPPWQDAQTPGAEVSGSASSAATHYGWFAFLNDAGRSGKSLLWNPLEGCGTPFFAMWETRCLSPFSLPFYVLPLQAAFLVSALLKLVVAGWCAYLAGRRFGYAAPMALAGGVSFEFCTGMRMWSHAPVSDALPWLPLVVLLTERLAVSQTQFWPLLALVFGVIGLGGAPGMLVSSVAFSGVFLVLRLVTAHAPLKAVLINTWSCFAAVFFGLAVTAIHLLPYYEFLQEAHFGDDPGAVVWLKDLAFLFFPNLLDHVGARAAGGLVRDPSVLKVIHVGLVQWMLFVFWLSFRGFAPTVKRKRVTSLFCASLVFTAYAFIGSRFTGGTWGGHLFTPVHFLAWNAIVFALIAVAAAEQWLVLRAEEIAKALSRLSAYLPVAYIVGVVLLFVFRSEPRAGAPVVWVQLGVMTGSGLAVLLLMAVTLFYPSTRLMGYGLTALTFAALLLAGGYPGGTPKEAVFPRTDFVEALQENGARVAGSVKVGEWPLSGNLVPQVYAPTGVKLARTQAFLSQAADNPLLLERCGAQDFVLTKEDIHGPFARLRSKLAIRHVFSTGAVLFHDIQAKPRAWVAYEGRSVGRFDAEALSADLPPLLEGALMPGGAAAPEAKVTVTDPMNTRVDIDVETTRPGVLVLHDAWYPGWKATVEGVDAPVFPVDGMFRGVVVKEGKQHVEFYYTPQYLKSGMLITLAAALIILFEMRHLPVRRQEY